MTCADVCPGQMPFGPIEEAHPAGFEPAHTAPEAVALSPELWGPLVAPRVCAGRSKSISSKCGQTRLRSASVTLQEQITSRRG